MYGHESYVSELIAVNSLPTVPLVYLDGYGMERVKSGTMVERRIFSSAAVAEYDAYGHPEWYIVYYR
jgi:hypothetical protein